MGNKSFLKIVIIVFIFTTVSIGIYLRWSSTEYQSSWGKGILTVAERTFYFERINRILENWQETKGNAEIERDGRLSDSYDAYLVIDIKKNALWIEENGRIRQGDYVEFAPKMKWTLRRYISQSSTVLRNLTILKIRGINDDLITPENFSLVGTGDEGYLYFYFNSHVRSGGAGTGSYNIPSNIFPSAPDNEDDLYGSIIVTEEEYQRYRSLIAESNLSSEKSTLSQIFSELVANKAAWDEIEKQLYMEIDKQIIAAGYELSTLKVESGPDFSAGHAELRARSSGFIKRFSGGSGSVASYLQIDNLGNDIWYVNSAPNPQRSMLPRRQLVLEFLVCSQDDIPGSQYKELIEQGRKQQQQQLTSVLESKWKAELQNGVIVELIGICENPSSGQQWWGPDGSSLDFVPYIYTKSLRGAREDGKTYEFAWRTIGTDGRATTSSFDGSMRSSYLQVLDRYGNLIGEDFSALRGVFDESALKTTFRIGFTDNDWQTALVVEDEAGEINFLERQRIVLNPPVIENGQIVIRCYEAFRTRIREYQTDFVLIIREGPTTQTVPLRQYREQMTNDRDTGLREYKFIIDDLSMSQIECVCFRYRPYRFVTFKNISLVPGRNMGFEIEVEDGQ